MRRGDDGTRVSDLLFFFFFFLFFFFFASSFSPLTFHFRPSPRQIDFAAGLAVLDVSQAEVDIDDSIEQSLAIILSLQVRCFLGRKFERGNVGRFHFAGALRLSF